jgi:pimeloyl-ACP methyl ester carboxylesterase
MIKGDDGSPLETVGTTLYFAMNQQFDIVIPDIRGTGQSSLITCDDPTTVACQVSLADKYGKSLSGFSVDSVANDTLRLISEINVDGGLTYLYGLSYGSHLVHRILQIQPAVIDAVVMDGVCVAPLCNLSRSDFALNNVGIQVLNRCSNDDSTCQQQFSNSTVDSLKQFYADINAVYNSCIGLRHLLVGFTQSNWKSLLSSIMADSELRTLVPMIMYRLKRCSFDDRKAILNLFDIITEYLSERDITPDNSTVIKNHFLISEFGGAYADLQGLVNWDTSSLFSNSTTLAVATLASNGWLPAPVSIYYGYYATYNKPMLMLNGDLDHYSPLSSAIAFASKYNSTNQYFVMINNTGYNTALFSHLKTPGNMTCAMLLMQRFFSSPNSSLNTTCGDMYGLNFTVPAGIGPYLWNDLWDGTVVYDTLAWYDWYDMAQSIFISTIALTTLIAVIIYRKQQPLRSRIFQPYFGLSYIFWRNVYQFLFQVLGAFLIPQLYIYPAMILLDALLQFAVTACFIQYIRYFMLAHTHALAVADKNSVFFNDRTLRIITSKWTYFLSTLFSGLLILFGEVIMQILYYEGLATDDDMLSTFDWIINVFLLVPAVFLLICWVADLINNKRSKLFKSYQAWREHFVDEDPLVFRLEAITLMVAVLLGIVYGVVRDSDSGFGPKICTLLWHTSMIIAFGGFSLAVILARKATRKNIRNRHSFERGSVNMNSGDELLQAVISDADGYRFFLEYCKHELSSENLLFYTDLMAYIAKYDTITKEQRYSGVVKLQNKFLRQTSKVEVNMPGHLHIKLTKFKLELTREETVADKQVLEDMRTEIVKNLLDTFKRAKNSSKFHTFIKNKEESSELAKKVFKI